MKLSALAVLLVSSLGVVSACYSDECPPNYPEPYYGAPSGSAPVGAKTVYVKCPPPPKPAPTVMPTVTTTAPPAPVQAPSCKTAGENLRRLGCPGQATPAGVPFETVCEDQPRVKSQIACLTKANSCDQMDSCARLICTSRA